MAEPENLNIEFNIGELILHTLNKYRYKVDAAKSLGIAERTLQRYICKYHLVFKGHDWVKNLKKKIIIDEAGRIQIQSGNN
jgi:hypothetical protein